MAGRVSESGAGDSVLVRYRGVFLKLAIFAYLTICGGGVSLAIRSGCSPLDAIPIGVGVVLALFTGYLCIQHASLSALAAAAPLPGLLWAAALQPSADFGAVPALACAFAYAVALALAQGTVARTVADTKLEPPYLSAAAGAGLLAALSAMWFRGSDAGPAAFQATTDTVVATLSTMLVMPVGTHFMRFDETFVVEVNRARERHLRVLERLAMVAVPRWGVSVTGIAVILMTIGIFESVEAEKAMHFRYGVFLVMGSLIMVFAFGASVTTRWRDGLASVVACALVCLMGLWACAVPGPVTTVSLVSIFQVVALAMFLIASWGVRTSFYRRHGNDHSVARLRAVEDTGASQVFAVAGGIVLLLPTLLVHPSAAVYVVTLIFAAVAGVIFAPAASAAAEVLAPQKRKIEDLYGRR